MRASQAIAWLPSFRACKLSIGEEQASALSPVTVSRENEAEDLRGDEQQRVSDCGVIHIELPARAAISVESGAVDSLLRAVLEYVVRTAQTRGILISTLFHVGAAGYAWTQPSPFRVHPSNLRVGTVEATQATNHSSLVRTLRSAARLAALIGGALTLASSGPALSQTSIGQADESAHENAVSAPVAHVYVATASHVYAFSAAADGKLAPVPGSPFRDSLSWMWVNGHYLFGTEADGTTIASFSMASDGALKKVATTNAANFYQGRNGGGCSPLYAMQFRIDHSGRNLYNAAVPEDEFCGTVFQIFSINDDNGELTYMGASDYTLDGGSDIGFLGNNKYAYSPEFLEVDGNQSAYIAGYKRLSDGELVDAYTGNLDGGLGPQPSVEQGGVGGYFFPRAVAPDPTDHMAVILGSDYGQPVIATYTADANGALSTTSTYENMPVASTGTAWIRMSPSGKLLAVGGSGLEIFHFNGANPVTKYKLLLSHENILQFFWDKNNHLYAIESDGTPGTGKLYVYTITPTSVTEAPGSPYSIPNPANMIVQTL